MDVLALEPFFGGSHEAFLNGWSARSRHRWTILSLPARKWKWRMRHAAVTLADQVREHVAAGARWDVLFCSDMLNLAEFRGLAPRAVAALPAVVYFHENQFVYPFRYMGERDLHFGFTNMTTALAADSVWFNSPFNRDSFLSELRAALRKMPDYRLPDVSDRIAAKTRIESPGVAPIEPATRRAPGPLRIVWAARWEYDKDPETLFAALRLLRDRDVSFRVSVIGEQYAEVPPVFADAQREFRAVIDRWGYQPTRAEYENALREADVFVSTAQHEFFGLSVVEGIAAGLFPLLPHRLSYPGLLEGHVEGDAADFFYDGDAETLATRLAELSGRLAGNQLWQGGGHRARRAAERFFWPQRSAELDGALENCANRSSASK